MLAFPEISVNVFLLALLMLSGAAFGFLINNARLRKEKSAVLRLESEMLQNHAEILHLQKELSDKENLQSKTPIFSISDNASESLKVQVKDGRLSKKVSGGSNATS